MGFVWGLWTGLVLSQARLGLDVTLQLLPAPRLWDSDL